MAELSNCSICGNIFVKTTSSFCPACRQEIDKKFNRVYDFIRKKANREATIHEVHKATGVEEELIIEFIREGRLRTSQFKNLKYPCEACGRPIEKGTICEHCQKDFQKELTSFESEQARQQRKEIENKYGRTYYTQPKKKS